MSAAPVPRNRRADSSRYGHVAPLERERSDTTSTENGAIQCVLGGFLELTCILSLSCRMLIMVEVVNEKRSHSH